MELQEAKEDVKIRLHAVESIEEKVFVTIVLVLQVTLHPHMSCRIIRENTP